MSRTRCKYKTLNKRTGEWEPWSGVFETKKEARRWYKRYGGFHEQRGHQLKLFDVKSEENEDNE